MSTQLDAFITRPDAGATSPAPRTPRSSRHPLRAPVLALALGLLVAAPTQAATSTSEYVAASQDAAGALAQGTGGHRVATTENTDALKYWTAERMKNSRPVPIEARGHGAAATEPADRGVTVELPAGRPAPGATDAAPDARSSSLSSSTGGTQSATSTVAAMSASATSSEGYWQASNTASPNAQIGHLFFQQWDPTARVWLDYNCSGTVVNTENKSVVWTAGHCVYETHTNTWNRNYVFCPGYRAGDCALGRWTPYYQRTTTQWQNSVCTLAHTCTENEFLYDFGALQMNTINGWKIGAWVGYHGIKFNGASIQTRYLFGYPLNKSNGEYLYYCYGTNTVAYGNLRMPCTAGGGASGGPWLSEINGTTWLGVVHSVNSHGGATVMAGPYQGSVALSMYNLVRY